MSVPQSTRSPRAVASFVLVTLIWGSTWFVIKDQIGVLPPAWAVTYRFILAAAGMFALGALRGDRLLLPRPAMGFAAIVGLFQFSGNFQFVYAAEAHITSGLVAVIFALLIVPNTLLARAFMGTQVSGRFIAGSGAALVGIGLLMVHEYRVAPAGSTVVLAGFGLTVLGVLSASVSNVMQSSQTARGIPATALIGWAMVAGALADGLFAWASAGSPPLDLGLRPMLGIAYLAIVGSVVTFPLYFALIRDWGPGPAAYTSVLIPVVAMTISTVLEHYRWSALAAAGAALALIGLMIALSRPKAGG